MKIAINATYGGFSLSPKAYKRYAELRGMECHFFNYENEYTPITLEEAEKNYFFIVHNTPTPTPDPANWHELSLEDRRKHNESTAQETIHIGSDIFARASPELIQTIEELGREANGRYADLKIVEIPDDVPLTTLYIDEYDGWEKIEEQHRSWS